MFGWEEISSFGSLRERDSFVRWLQAEIASGTGEEITAPVTAEAGERWYRQMATGGVWRLVPESNPYGPGFWPAYEEIAA